MKIIEWINKIKEGRKTKLLSENNKEPTNENSFEERKRGFFSRLHRDAGNGVSENREREEILKELVKDVRVEEPFPYNITYDEYKFMKEIKSKDKNGVLMEDDKKALFCIKNAICDGNDLLEISKEIVEKVTDGIKTDKNVINEFLGEFPNSIIVLIDLMKQEAKKIQKELNSDNFDYISVAKLIEEYNQEKEAGIEQ